MAVEDGAFQRAVPLLEKVIASDPGIHIAQLNLGIARARQKQYAPIAPLKGPSRLQPEVMIAHYELALALYKRAISTTAASHFQIVARADAEVGRRQILARIRSYAHG